MIYKVNYYTLAVLKSGEVGNIIQNKGVYYTNANIAKIEFEINKRFDVKKKVAVVTKIEQIEGDVLEMEDEENE